MGIPATTDQILTPAVAAVAWLRRHDIEAVRRCSSPTPRRRSSPSWAPSRTASSDGAGAVVVGDLGEGWDFATLNRAFRLLMSDPAAPDRPGDDPLLARRGRAPARCGGRSCGRWSTPPAGPRSFSGKPDPAFYASAVEALGLEPSQVVMVGDDVRADVEGAQRAGLTGVLVRTGKFSPSDLDGEVRPDAVLDSIADLPRWWAER